MKTRPLAASVHLLTASGAAIALMALIAAAQERWPLMALWLGLALVVDGIDGPLARKLEVEKNAPDFDGAVLDLVIDYLTYVFIPAYAFAASGILPSPWALAAGLIVAFTGALYFAGVHMKNEDNTFRGFPTAWQMVLVVLLTLEPSPAFSFPLIALLAAAQFAPLKFIHPVRTVRWRPINLPVTIAWGVFAAWSVLAGFDPPRAVQLGLLVTSLWLLCIGLFMGTGSRR